MIPEQQERLDNLRAKQGQPVREVPSEKPIHLGHAHTGTDKGMTPCICPDNCLYCNKGE